MGPCGAGLRDGRGGEGEGNLIFSVHARASGHPELGPRLRGDERYVSRVHCTDSYFKQPAFAPLRASARQANAPPPLFFAARGRRRRSRTKPGISFPSAKCRGDGAPRGAHRGRAAQTSVRSLRPSFALRGAGTLGEGCASRGAPSRLFCPRRRSFRAGQEGAPLLGAPYPAGFRPPSFPPRPALEGQPVFMPADGWPGPPERGVTSPARGRRALLHHRDVSRRRPQPSKASGAWTGSVAKIWIIFLEFFSAIFPQRTVSPRYGRGTSRFRRACCCARFR